MKIIPEFFELDAGQEPGVDRNSGLSEQALEFVPALVGRETHQVDPVARPARVRNLVKAGQGSDMILDLQMKRINQHHGLAGFLAE